MRDSDFYIEINPKDFVAWTELHGLLVKSFSYMTGRIDPPSSLQKLSISGLQAKADVEDLFLALRNETLIGCMFGTPKGHRYYVGKLAVDETARGYGVARQLIASAAQIAQSQGRAILELQTRVELVENHKAFQALGFEKTAETAHRGFDRPTSYTYQKRL